MKVLIADDSMFMRNFLKEVLLKKWPQLNILEAVDGDEAIAIFKSEYPDLVLLDIVMPKKDGLVVLREIGQTANVFVVSAVGQEKVVEEAKILGAKDFLVKPFDTQKIIEKITPIVEASIPPTYG